MGIAWRSSTIGFWKRYPIWFPFAMAALAVFIGYHSKLKNDIFWPSANYASIMREDGIFLKRYNVAQPYPFKVQDGGVISLYCADNSYENRCITSMVSLGRVYRIYYAPFEHNILGVTGGIVLGINSSTEVLLSKDASLSDLRTPAPIPKGRERVAKVVEAILWMPLCFILAFIVFGCLVSIRRITRKGE